MEGQQGKSIKGKAGQSKTAEWGDTLKQPGVGEDVKIGVKTY